MLFTYLDLLLFLSETEIPIFQVAKAQRSQYRPARQESFVVAEETERTNGQTEQWGPRSRGQSQGMTFVF